MENQLSSQTLHDSFKGIAYDLDDFDYELEKCLKGWKFLVQGPWAIIAAFIELLGCIAVNAYLIITLCRKTRHISPLY